MSMKRLAVLTAAQHSAQHQSLSSSSNSSSNSTLGEYAPAGRYNITTSNGASKTGRFETDLHGNVNVLLGGAMLSGVITVVVLICYCCHRNIRKHRPQEYSQYWRPEPDVHSLEVFTMDSHAIRFECTSGSSQIEATQASLPGNPAGVPGPPPAYESLIFGPQSTPSPSDKKESPGSPAASLPGFEQTIGRSKKEEEGARCKGLDEGLPSYEAALKLEADGYV